MRKDLEEIREKIEKIQIKETPITFLEIIGKSRNEVIISSLVAFVLNPDNTNKKIIAQLLEKTKNINDKCNFIELLNDKDNIFETIQTEEWLSNRSRIDIIIRFSKFWIVIENKVDSYENGDQSLRYEEELKNKDVPVKYICLKPNYNKCVLINKNFAEINYSELVQILRGIPEEELNKKESYIYIKELIKHSEVYLMNDNEIEIGEDVDFYIEYKDKIEKIINNYKKQSKLVEHELVKRLERKFKEECGYQTFYHKTWNYFQVWKEHWNNENHNGIHFEIFCDFSNLIGKKAEIVFAIHNEAKTKKIYPNIKSNEIRRTFEFDNLENIENSINLIIEEFNEIIQENVDMIDEEIC